MALRRQQGGCCHFKMAGAAPAAPPEAADFDWGTWDRLPFNDEPNEQPPDPKRPKWGGPCAGKGPGGKGCRERWSSLWSGRKGEPQFCKISACYKEWQAGKSVREEERALSRMSEADKARADRKRQKPTAAIEVPHEQPALAQTTQPYAASAVAVPVSQPASGVWDPVNIKSILGQRWREPTAMQPWERRNHEKFFQSGPEFIVWGSFSDQPEEDTVGVQDAQWVSLTDITSIFGAEAALEKVREWLAYVERESAAHIAQVEQQASKFGPQPGLPDDAVPTGQPTRDADQHSQHSVAVASAADADTQYSDDDGTETPLGGASWRRPRSQAASDVY